MLGGMIEVRSTPGLGSTFTLSLSPRIVTGPAAKTASNALASDEPTGPGPAPPPLTGRRILLAEDGIDNQRLIAFHLRRAGAEVEIAENGRVAIDRVVAAASAGQSFDVVLMDMQMPELDGYAATAQLREKGFRAPILALTAHALADDEDRCRMAGCDAHLTKPFDPPALVETILERTRNASGVRAAA
jgi:CheY-like chemotaxis protein